jgi:hypothetical protein
MPDRPTARRGFGPNESYGPKQTCFNVKKDARGEGIFEGRLQHRV